MKFAAFLVLWIGIAIATPSKAAEVVSKEDAIEAFREYRKAVKLIHGIHMDMLQELNVELDLDAEANIPEARIEDYKRARKHLEKSIVLNPYFPDAYMYLANSYWEIEEDLERTVEYYSKALDVDPDYEEILSARGHVHVLLKQVEAAERDLARLDALRSEFADGLRLDIADLKATEKREGE